MIYFDNAATTFPKPSTVTDEVFRCLTGYCGNPGRGAHPLAMKAAEKIYNCRELLSDFFDVRDPARVLFTQNTTYAINLALKGLLAPGSHILLSELEHNAVYRPVFRLAERGVITYDLFPVIGLTDAEILSGIRARLRPDTSAVVCLHASNICSRVLPVREIGALCRGQGLRFIVDAAQSAGRIPISLSEMHIDALAIPGHKSLYGIQGCGALLLGDGILPETWVEGGSGVDSLSPTMPELPPERYEAGTLPTPAIVGLSEGLEFLRERGIPEIEQWERALFLALAERLSTLPGIRVFEPDTPGAVLLFEKQGVPSADVARALAARGICVRAGLHCAPLAHRALGTPEGGAVRVSFGVFNTLREVDSLWRALKE